MIDGFSAKYFVPFGKENQGISIKTTVVGFAVLLSRTKQSSGLATQQNLPWLVLDYSAENTRA